MYASLWKIFQINYYLEEEEVDQTETSEGIRLVCKSEANTSEHSHTCRHSKLNDAFIEFYLKK